MYKTHFYCFPNNFLIVIIPFSDGICGYKIYKTHSGPLPFEVELKDRETGEADIIVSKDKKLNFEKREKYKFQIAAKDCSTPEKVSEK